MTSALRINLRTRRAATLGMTIEQYDEHIAAERRRLDEINALINNHNAMLAAIGKRALAAGRSFRIVEAA